MIRSTTNAPRTTNHGAARLLALAACLLAVSCQRAEPGGHDEPAPATTAPATPGGAGAGSASPQDALQEPTPPSASAAPSQRLALEPWLDLLGALDAAELSAGGAWVDLGSAAAEVYTLGAWLDGWRRPPPGEAGPASWLELDAPDAVLALPHDLAAMRELVVRARSSCTDATLTARLGDDTSSQAALTPEWSVVRLTWPQAVQPDASLALPTLQLASGGRCAGDAPRAELDWLWLAGEPGQSPPADLVIAAARGEVGAAPLELGGRVRRALVTPSTRTFSFHVDVPHQASLVLDAGASVAGARFLVDVVGDAGGRERVLELAPEAGRWQEARVDLERFSGQLVRLELRAEVPADGPGEVVAGFGEPALMREAPLDEDVIDAMVAPALSARNVVFVVIDTARADAFAAVEHGTHVQTPAYSRLAERGTVFTSAWNNANWTKPSVATMLSGLYPFVHGAQSRSDVLPAGVALLPEQLRASGIATAGFVSNGFISGRFGFERGWDFFRNYPREGLYENARTVYGDAASWIEARAAAGERFFAYVQPSDPHVPYRVERRFSALYHPQAYDGPVGPELDGHRQAKLSGDHTMLSAADYAWIRALYHGELSYHDEQMGVFFDKLEALGVLDETLVIVTNDHGEELDEHGQMGHGHTLYEELLRAPLLLRWPARVPQAVHVDVVVEAVDVPTTIVEALGLEVPAAHQGRSLFEVLSTPPDAPRSVAASAVATQRTKKRAVRVGDDKLMVSSDGTWAALYDLSADAGEQHELGARGAIVARRLALALAQAHAHPDKPTRGLGRSSGVAPSFAAQPSALEPELRRQLEALGYLGEE